MTRLAISCVLLALSVTSAFADESRMGVGLQVGTTGYGIDAAYKINDRVSARVGYAALDYSRSRNINNVDYDAKLKLSSFKLLADIGIGGGFRFSVGAVVHDNKVDVHGKPSSGSYTLNGNTYQASDIGNLDGRVKFGSGLAPYVGVGYGTLANHDAGLGFYADLGAMYQGKSKTSLNANCGSALSGAQCDQLKADVAVEEKKVNDKIDSYKWFPVLAVGLYYNF